MAFETVEYSTLCVIFQKENKLMYSTLFWGLLNILVCILIINALITANRAWTTKPSKHGTHTLVDVLIRNHIGLEEKISDGLVVDGIAIIPDMVVLLIGQERYDDNGVYVVGVTRRLYRIVSPRAGEKFKITRGRQNVNKVIVFSREMYDESTECLWDESMMGNHFIYQEHTVVCLYGPETIIQLSVHDEDLNRVELPTQLPEYCYRRLHVYNGSPRRSLCMSNGEQITLDDRGRYTGLVMSGEHGIYFRTIPTVY
jgi:hypothetical protein